MAYILVTNDDGVTAPGILALAEAMRNIGAVGVVAPAENQSASGHKKTLYTDIPYSETQWDRDQHGQHEFEKRVQTDISQGQCHEDNDRCMNDVNSICAGA